MTDQNSASVENWIKIQEKVRQTLIFYLFLFHFNLKILIPRRHSNGGATRNCNIITSRRWSTTSREIYTTGWTWSISSRPLPRSHSRSSTLRRLSTSCTAKRIFRSVSSFSRSTRSRPWTWTLRTFSRETWSLFWGLSGTSLSFLIWAEKGTGFQVRCIYLCECRFLRNFNVFFKIFLKLF